MRAIVGLWRWRHNPLRRTTDLLEAWVALAAALLIAVGAPVAGVAAGLFTEDALGRTVQQQRQQRHEVPATVVRALPQPPLDPDPETSTARDAHNKVIATWTAPDDTIHSGEATADLRSPKAGDHFTVWTDAHGTLVMRPLDHLTATTHAALAGIGAGAVSVAFVDGARRVLVWRIVRRRYARWDQAWEKAGPDWGRTGTGS